MGVHKVVLAVAAESPDDAAQLARIGFRDWANVDRGDAMPVEGVVHATVTGEIATLNIAQRVWQVEILYLEASREAAILAALEHYREVVAANPEGDVDDEWIEAEGRLADLIAHSEPCHYTLKATPDEVADHLTAIAKDTLSGTKEAARLCSPSSFYRPRS